MMGSIPAWPGYVVRMIREVAPGIALLGDGGFGAAFLGLWVCLEDTSLTKAAAVRVG